MSFALIFIICYSLCSSLLYLGLMFYYSKGISLLNTKNKPQLPNSTFLSVVVCFRNEEVHLPLLLKSLINQNYPPSNFEILLYNDASTDGSLAAIKNMEAQFKTHQIICRDVSVIQGSNSAKKLALNHAAANSKANLIVVTDADCNLDPNWLSLLAQTYQNQKAFLIAAPVAIISEKGWINDLQCIEMQALTAVTAGAIGNKKALMCNGANLAFDRKKFLELDPYKNNLHISSGDDMFLLMEMQKENHEFIVFLAHQNAIVCTKAKSNLKAYFDQRIRWASKSKSYQVYETKLVALLVLNMNIVLFFLPFIMLVGNCYIGLLLFVIILFIKQLADTLIISTYSKIISQKVNYKMLMFYQYLEAALTLIIALKSIKGSYVWKDRKQNF